MKPLKILQKPVLLMALAVPMLFSCGEEQAGSGASSEPTHPQVVYEDMTLDYYDEYEGYTVSDYKGSKKSFSIPATIKGDDGISYPITRIADKAFYNRSTIEEIELSSNLRYIGANAFEKTSLKTLYATGSLREVGKDAFIDTPFKPVEADGMYYLSSTSSETCVLYEGQYRGWNYTLPSGVESIICDALSEVDLGESVSLENLRYIGDHAFAGCPFKSLTFGSRLEGIGEEAFSGCTDLTKVEIPSGVTSIGSKAFAGCSALKTLNLPSSIKKMGTGLLYGITFDDPSSVSITLPFVGTDKETPIRADDLLSCYCYSDTAGIDLTIDHGVLASGAFAGIESEDRSTGKVWYGGSPRLPVAKLTLMNVTEIKSQAFFEVSMLEEVNFGASIAIIDYEAFRGCSFTYVYLPLSVKKVGRNAFMVNGYLEMDVAFTGLDVEVEGDLVPNGHVNYGVERSSETDAEGNYTSGKYKYKVSNGEAKISAYLGSETDVRVPDTLDGYAVKSIASHAFDDHPEVKTLYVPTASIDEEAFRGLTGLTSLTIWKSPNYESFYVGRAHEWFSKTQFTGSYRVKKSYFPINGYTIYVDAYIPSSLTSVTIGQTGNKDPLSLEMYAFAGFTSLTSITLSHPDHQYLLDQGCFYGCSNWNTSIYLSHACSVRGSALTGCSKVKVYLENESDKTAWGTNMGSGSMNPWIDSYTNVFAPYTYEAYLAEIGA